ncbi:MAG TPA: cytochrome b/b6 domain-containing protein [Burkholderiaceae bacterium]|nr:cytochrome b/b6 domain-containing protein [Burkholderiaceae bacterium]
MDRSADPATRVVRVWDLPTRLFHWTLAASVIASIITAHVGGDATIWHFRLGYLAFTLLVFRLLWGLFGGHWSRFGTFFYGPGALMRYLRGRPLPEDCFEIGHSPLGSLSVWALLILLVAQVASGLVADDETGNTGPLNAFVSYATASKATAYHKDYGQWILIALIVLHVGAVLFYLLKRRRNLIGAMWHGDKAWPQDLAGAVPVSRDTTGSRVFALVVLGMCVALVYAIVTIGG